MPGEILTGVPAFARAPHRLGVYAPRTGAAEEVRRTRETPAGREAVAVSNSRGNASARHRDVIRQARVAERPVPGRKAAAPGEPRDVRRPADDLVVRVVLLHNQHHMTDAWASLAKRATR